MSGDAAAWRAIAGRGPLGKKLLAAVSAGSEKDIEGAAWLDHASLFPSLVRLAPPALALVGAVGLGRPHCYARPAALFTESHRSHLATARAAPVLFAWGAF